MTSKHTSRDAGKEKRETPVMKTGTNRAIKLLAEKASVRQPTQKEEFCCAAATD